MKMKKFAFVNAAAEKEYKALPENIQDDFGKDLRLIQWGQKPLLDIAPLRGFGGGVIELKINGSPAHRCVYVTKYMDTVVVLHSFEKTTNGTDRQAMRTLALRLRELQAEARKIH